MAEDVADAVERQVRAYNARDLDGFLACFAEEVVIEDADGQTRMTGRESMREHYGQVLADFPDIKYEIVTRIRVGSYVVDERTRHRRALRRHPRDRDLSARQWRAHRPRALPALRRGACEASAEP
jgi:uncharacterized protein (TIGR02246 family)